VYGTVLMDPNEDAVFSIGINGTGEAKSIQLGDPVMFACDSDGIVGSFPAFADGCGMQTNNTEYCIWRNAIYEITQRHAPSLNEELIAWDVDGSPGGADFAPTLDVVGPAEHHRMNLAASEATGLLHTFSFASPSDDGWRGSSWELLNACGDRIGGGPSVGVVGGRGGHFEFGGPELCLGSCKVEARCAATDANSCAAVDMGAATVLANQAACQQAGRCTHIAIPAPACAQCPVGTSSSDLAEDALGDPCDIGGVTLTIAAATIDYFNPNGEAYEDNKICQWTISCRTGPVTVTFDKFQTEPGFDYVTLYDGTSTKSDQRGSWAGGNPEISPVVSSGNHLTIIFESDHGIRKPGFQATYSCGMEGEQNEDGMKEEQVAMEGGADHCVQCPPGKHDHDEDAGTPCKSCPPGTISSVARQECLTCPPGTHTEVRFTDSFVEKCASCSIGKYDHDSSAETKCVACPAGSVTDRYGMTECTTCVNDRLVNDDSQCSCPEGTVPNFYGEFSHCLLTPESRACSRSACVPCDPGAVQASSVMGSVWHPRGPVPQKREALQVLYSDAWVPDLEMNTMSASSCKELCKQYGGNWCESFPYSQGSLNVSCHMLAQIVGQLLLGVFHSVFVSSTVLYDRIFFVQN
jgi:hypothetical protein